MKRIEHICSFNIVSVENKLEGIGHVFQPNWCGHWPPSTLLKYIIKEKTKNKKFLSEYSYAQLGLKSSLLSHIYSTLSPFLSPVISSKLSLVTP